MLDVTGTSTTTTMWQDNHSGLRRHKLMTKELGEKIPRPLRQRERQGLRHRSRPREAVQPYANWTWYVTEWNPRTGECFGLVDGFEMELGYFDLTEMAEATVRGIVPAIERDLYWEPKTIGEIRSESQGRQAALATGTQKRGHTTDKERSRPCQTRTERKQPARTP